MVLTNETEIEMLLFDQERIVGTLLSFDWKNLSDENGVFIKVTYKELSSKLNVDPCEARKYLTEIIRITNHNLGLFPKHATLS